ncbi:hypothetical protein [Tessaracoccus sp. MC1756]|uniref:hypothetical protein n=1 Tax=Tessaracoccus sp. MC1756 TaxID=2760311 RepID=UPI001600956F|nr:hypothetical protein [Tessaracoccus sp. MC1756]MBB1510329.1 hypothetical protein [Tessaracoccus sp. MC1756]
MSVEMVHSRLGQAALVVGGVVLAMIAAMFFINSDETRAWVFTGMFFALTLAVALVAFDDLHRRHERVTLRPRTKPGRWALWLSVAGMATMLLSGVYGAIVRMGQPTELGPFVPMFVFTIAGFGLMLEGGVVSLIAWFRSDERSWLVLLPLLPALFAVYFVIGEFTFPH